MESGKCGGLLGALLFGGGSGGGAGGGTMYVEETETNGAKTLNKNFKEITDAVAAGKTVILHQHLQAEGEPDSEMYFLLGATAFEPGYYEVAFLGKLNYIGYSSDSETGVLTQ